MPSSRRAFTLVELLVVIAIVGVLLALAVLHYESDYHQFPPAGRGYGWCQHPELYGDQVIYNSNGLVLLLPYLEQGDLYGRYDSTQCASNCLEGNTGCCAPVKSVGTLAGDAVASGNADVEVTPLTIFRCPSDPGNLQLPNGFYYSIKDGAPYHGVKTNYDFCTSSYYLCNAWRLVEPANERRMFGENSTTRVADVADGLSNTIMLAEVTLNVWNGSCTPWGFRGWVQVGVNPGNGINTWWLPGYGLPGPVVGQLISWSYMGSLHPGGANAAYADGSVHFLQENTDHSILNHLSAMADGSAVASLP